MLAMFIEMGQTCLLHQFCSRPDMPAIFSDRDYKCLSLFQNKKSISCKTRSLPVHSDWAIKFLFAHYTQMRFDRK